MSRRAKWVWGVLLVVAAVGGWVGWAEWSVERTLKRALAAADAGDLPTARKLLDECLAKRPGSGRLKFEAARAARRVGDFAAARRFLDEAKAAGWPAETVAFEEKLMAAQTGRFAAVEPELFALVRTAPDHPDADAAREVLIPGYLNRFALAPAQGLAKDWAVKRPTDARLQKWLFEACRNTTDTDAAVAALRRGTELDPTDPGFRAAAGFYLLERKQPAEAATHFDYLLARDAADLNARLGKARCLRQLGEFDAAGDILGKLLFAQPNDTAALAEAGQLDIAAGRPAAAVEKLKKATDLRPAEPNALFGLALALEQSGKPADAALVRSRQVALEADMTALREVQQKVAADPTNADLRHQAGALLVKNGELMEGARWLQSALAEDPDHAPTRRALADLARRPAGGR